MPDNDPIEALPLAWIRSAFDFLSPHTLAAMGESWRSAGTRSAAILAEVADEALVANIGEDEAACLSVDNRQECSAAKWIHDLAESGATNPPLALLPRFVEQIVGAYPGGFVSKQTIILLFERLGETGHDEMQKVIVDALPGLFVDPSEDGPAIWPTPGGGTLALPGTKRGACAVPCEHLRCAHHRAIADAHCVFCEEPIGYGHAYVVQTVDHDDGAADVENGPHPGDGPVTMLAHRSCADDATETERRMREEGSSVEF